MDLHKVETLAACSSMNETSTLHVVLESRITPPQNLISNIRSELRLFTF